MFDKQLFILVVACLLLVVFTVPTLYAQNAPCGDVTNPHEIFVEAAGDPVEEGGWELTVYGEDGNPITTAKDASGATITWPFSFQSDVACDLVLDAVDHTSHSDIRLNLHLTTSEVFVFEFVQNQVEHRFTYGNANCPGYGTATYCYYSPNNSLGVNQDYYVEIGASELRLSHNSMWSAGSGGGVLFFDEVFDDGSGNGLPWVMPYEFDAVCEYLGKAPTSSCWDNDNEFTQFVSPQTNYPLDEDDHPVYTFSGLVDIRRENGLDEVWRIEDMTLEFQEGTSLIVENDLTLEDLNFTEAETDQGWDGIYYQAGATGTLTGVTVEEVRGQAGTKRAIWCGVSSYDADVTLRGTTAQDGGLYTYGVCVGGANGEMNVEEDPNASQGSQASRLLNNEAGGAYAYGGGLLRISDSEVSTNFDNGVTVTGPGSVAYIWENLIEENDGVGVASSSSGNAVFRSDSGPVIFALNNRIIANEGGALLANNGGLIDAGIYINGACIGACNNRILDHQTVAPFEAKSVNGSYLYGEWDFWGDGRTLSDINTVSDMSSLLDIDPLWDGTSSLIPGAEAAMKSFQAEGREASADLVARAMQAAAEEDHTSASALLLAALQAAADDDARRLAYSVGTAYVARPGVPEPPSGLVLALEAHATESGQPVRPWALRMLMALHGAQGRIIEGRQASSTLVADYPNTEHARFGYGVEVALALRAGDVEGARSALAAMAAEWPDDGETEAAWILELVSNSVG